MSDEWVVYFVECGLDGEQWESHVEYLPTQAAAEVACAEWQAADPHNTYLVQEAF